VFFVASFRAFTPSTSQAVGGAHSSVTLSLTVIGFAGIRVKSELASGRSRDGAFTMNSIHRLLTPASGLRGQGARYALAGAFVAGVYILTTTCLAVVVGMPFRDALAIGFVLQLAVHFTLQRLFVWVHEEEFALPFHRQARRYLTVAGAQFGVTAVSTSVLPSLLGLAAEVVYLVTVALLTIANFLLFRNVVFHPDRTRSTSLD
jgi:putative flippase GtrA